jgi:hypothetical protein
MSRCNRFNSESAIQYLNNTLTEKQPKTFSSSWIFFNALSVYQYIQKNVRTEDNTIDWDTITRSIDRSFSKRWIRYRYKQVRPYRRQGEVDLILERYKEKLYVFLSPADDYDKRTQDRMVIRLVRLGQRGNVCAQEELVKWVTFITDDWIDRYPQMYRWKGYEDEVPDKIRACIRCYRYTGSFLGYLFKTLEYSARGKPPLVSLDDKILDGNKTRIEYVRAIES